MENNQLSLENIEKKIQKLKMEEVEKSMLRADMMAEDINRHEDQFSSYEM